MSGLDSPEDGRAQDGMRREKLRWGIMERVGSELTVGVGQKTKVNRSGGSGI